MFSDLNSLTGNGILHLSLDERISAVDLMLMIQAVDDLYFGYLWLDKAQGGDAPDLYQPTEEETLYINRLEIGTPNLIKFIGKLRPLAYTAKVVAAALDRLDGMMDGLADGWRGSGSPGVHVIEIDARHRQDEKKKQDVEKLLETARGLYETAQELYKDGKITEEQLAHKRQMEEAALLIINQVMGKHVKDVKFVVA